MGRFHFGGLVGGVGKACAFHKGLPLFRDDLKDEAAFHGGEEDVRSFPVGRRAAHPVAEAGREGRGAGLRHDGRGVTTRTVVRILELAFQIRAVEHHEAARVTGTAAEKHRGFGVDGSLKRGGQLGGIFGVLDGLEGHQRFALRQHGLLGRGRGAAQKRVDVCRGELFGRPGTKDHARAFLTGSQHAMA